MESNTQVILLLQKTKRFQLTGINVSIIDPDYVAVTEFNLILRLLTPSMHLVPSLEGFSWFHGLSAKQLLTEIPAVIAIFCI